MKKAALFLAVFAFTFCQKKTAEPTVSDEKMTAILADCYAVEATLQTADVVAKDSLTKKYLAQIFELHQVKKLDFEQSLEAVARQPARLDSILARAERQLFQQKKPASEVPKDSVRRLGF